MRLVRWVGDPNPWNDPHIFRGLLEQRFPLAWAEQIREFDVHQRICVIPGKSELTIGPLHGFSQTYTFGLRQFAVWMEDADAALLLGNEWDRWQFLDITDAPSTTDRPPLGKDGWKSLLTSFAKLGRRRWLKPQYR